MFRTIQIVSLSALLLGAEGCATHALWSEADLDTWNEPAENPNLRLFRTEKKKDFLVVYDEYRERNDATHARAYLLNANRHRLQQGQQPHFVSAKRQQKLPSVSIFHTNFPPGINEPQMFYAVANTNGPSFRIFSNEAEISFNELPVYNDGAGRAKRIALTPVAVTCDLTIIGGWIFLWYLVCRRFQ